MNRLRLLASVVLAIAGSVVLIVGMLPSASSSGADNAAVTQPGSAFASATVLGVNPEYGGFSLAVRAGESAASYTGAQSTANSNAVDAGYLGSTLTGGAPVACLPSSGGTTTTTSPTSSVINGLEISSDNGANSSTGDGGIESVTVNPSPESGTATTSLLPVGIPDLLSLTSKAVTNVDYHSGQYQEADAHTTIGLSLLNGLVSLNGLTWTASQSDGTQSTSTATFSVGSITVSGQTTAITNSSQLAPAIAVANKVLGLVGINIILPTQSTDSVTGAVTISPLLLQLAGTSLFNTVLHQLNPAQQQLEDEIASVLKATGNACIESLATYIGVGELVAGIVEGIMAGAGTIDLEIGGASADTQVAPDYSNPLDASNPLANGSAENPSALPASSFPSGSSLGTNTGPVSSSVATTPPAQASAGTSGSTLSSTTLVHCISASPSDRPGCSSGDGTIALGVLLLGAGVLFAADFVRSRRRLARPKETL
ncbi:MAG TPA: hypothetical protein VGG38_16850 [Acidimicrobiales bacterium]|jgi:hypothetical protein